MGLKISNHFLFPLDPKEVKALNYAGTKKVPEQPKNAEEKRKALSDSVPLSCIKGTLVTGKFLTINNYLGHFHMILANNNRGPMRTNFLVTDADFKDVYSLQY